MFVITENIMERPVYKYTAWAKCTGLNVTASGTPNYYWILKFKNLNAVLLSKLKCCIRPGSVVKISV
jgi:hypothetical protein